MTGPVESVTVSVTEQTPSRTPPGHVIVWRPISGSESKTDTTSRRCRAGWTDSRAQGARLKDAASESARPSPFGEMAAGRIPNPEASG